jgi:integrase
VRIPRWVRRAGACRRNTRRCTPTSRFSLLTGARTEELRALTWSHVDLDGEPPSVQAWRSVRKGGDTKTRLWRRTLELPKDCVVALRAHRQWQAQSRMRNAARWPDNDLVFTTQLGTPLDAANVRRAFR